MKIIHTSDWHLGQNFYTKSRQSEHEAFLNWLLSMVKAHHVDAILVSGDIFDTTTPPSYAREMYNQFVVEANKLNCQLVLLAGNHDSVAVLNESKQLLKYLNATVVASVDTDHQQQLVELKGSSGHVEALVCAIPFVRPRDVLKSEAGVVGTERQKQLGEAIKRHYNDLYQYARKRQQALLTEYDLTHCSAIPIIATGHLTALGVTQSESVRDIYVGNLEGFAADGFPPVDYIALGHIHRPQIVAKSEHIRYSGSPIALSFDELKTTKQVVLVDFQPASSNSEAQRVIQPLDVPRFQPMMVIKGKLTELADKLMQACGEFQQKDEESVSEAKRNHTLPLWLSIEVTTHEFMSDLNERVAEITAGFNVEVVQLRRTKERHQHALQHEQAETLSELTALEVFHKRLDNESFQTTAEQEQKQRITNTFAQIMNDALIGTEIDTETATNKE